MKYHQAIRYDNLMLRVGGSLFAAVFITLFDTDTNLFVAMKYLSFYMVVGFSFAVGLVLTSIVHHVTLRLDGDLDWQEAPYSRSLFQVSFGVCLPVIIAYFIMLLYFRYIDGRDIHESKYMVIDFPHIVYFLLILNLYYVIHYLVIKLQREEFLSVIRQENLKMEKRQIPIRSPTGEMVAVDVTVPANMQETTMQSAIDSTEGLVREDNDATIGETELEPEEMRILSKLSNICFFYRHDGTNRIVFMDGHSAIIGLSLDRIEYLITEQLAGDMPSPFYRINRKVLIGKCAFDLNETNFSTRNNTLEVYPRFLSTSVGIQPDLFKIGRSNIEGLKVWIEQQHQMD